MPGQLINAHCMRNDASREQAVPETGTPSPADPIATGPVDDAVSGPTWPLTAATARIRSFCRDERRLLTYLSTSSDPYRDDGARIDIYADTDGYEYWIDAADGILVQVGPGQDRGATPRPTGPGRRLSVPALRSEAVATASENVPGFKERKNSLHPLEDNRRGEVYFFRWDDFSRPSTESQIPPFVQVALYADGSLAGYTDTLPR